MFLDVWGEEERAETWLLVGPATPPSCRLGLPGGTKDGTHVLAVFFSSSSFPPSFFPLFRVSVSSVLLILSVLASLM